MKTKVRYEKQGGHFHVRIFTSQAWDQTFANCGTLVFREDEWNIFKAGLESGFAKNDIKLIDEGEDK